MTTGEGEGDSQPGTWGGTWEVGGDEGLPRGISGGGLGGRGAIGSVKGGGSAGFGLSLSGRVTPVPLPLWRAGIEPLVLIRFATSGLATLLYRE